MKNPSNNTLGVKFHITFIKTTNLCEDLWNLVCIWRGFFVSPSHPTKVSHQASLYVCGDGRSNFPCWKASDSLFNAFVKFLSALTWCKRVGVTLVQDQLKVDISKSWCILSCNESFPLNVMPKHCPSVPLTKEAAVFCKYTQHFHEKANYF